MAQDDGSRDMSTAIEFQDFIHRLFAAMPEAQISETSGRSEGADLVATVGGSDVLIEAKTPTPQTAYRLREAVQQLQSYGRARQPGSQGHQPRLILAIPGIISPRKSTVIPHTIELWDGKRLRDEARRLDVRAPAFLAMPSEARPSQDQRPIDDLIEHLGHIAPGNAEWPSYEKFCEDMLNVLFSPPLNAAIAQSRNESGYNRRDFVLPNYAVDGFWAFMRANYRADYLVTEVKNFSTPVKKSAVLQLANYLTRHGVGLVGLLISRYGLSSDARWTCREQWLLHDKLIIGLDDEDVRQMLVTRQAGGDPSDLIRQRIEDFRLRM